MSHSTTNYNLRFQDMNFNVKNAKGKKLEQLIGAEYPDDPEHGPVSIFLKLEGLNWSEYYLDVCFGTWGDYETKKWNEIESDEEEHAYHDYAEKFGVKELLIKTASCKDNEITLEFENNVKLILKYKDPDDWEGACEMIKVP